ncbi:Coenzyme A disulfide reductase [Diplonema papillatum]|nr:Coenzyme A disulfide reductase [Diplonema papillatum]
MQKTVIVGGVAGGASAAARARRLNEKMQIVMFERGPYVSFANCGLPYHIGGEITDRSKLILQTPESFAARFNVDVRVHSEVTDIDRKKQTVDVKNNSTGKTYKEKYDYLILSPGAEPMVPPIPGLRELVGDKVFTLRNIPDMDAIIAGMSTSAAKHATVVGGGFIGLEMAEALRHRGFTTVLIEKTPQVMGPVDEEMASYLHKEMKDHGIDLRLSVGASKFEKTADGSVRIGLDNGDTVETGLVILCIGVRPDVHLAKKAGLEIGQTGGIVVDPAMRTNDPKIFAVGDAIETESFVCSGKKVLAALAGPANRQGRLAANTIMNLEGAYKKTQGTAVCKVFDLTVGCVGMNERTLKRFGIAHKFVYLHAGHHAGYYPGSEMCHFKLIFAPEDGRILGAQMVGKEGVDKRIDVLAVAQRAGMTVYDLQDLELAYAPPYNSAKDIINQAGFLAKNMMSGLAKLCYTSDMDNTASENVILDVRTPDEIKEEGAINDNVNTLVIPVDELRQRVSELPKDKHIMVYCRTGMRGHVAAMELQNMGYSVSNLTGGYRTWQAIHSRL